MLSLMGLTLRFFSPAAAAPLATPSAGAAGLGLEGGVAGLGGLHTHAHIVYNICHVEPIYSVYDRYV